MTIKANGAKFTGKSVSFVYEDKYRANAQKLTDGRIIVQVYQRFGGFGAWCNSAMEEWNGDKLLWGTLTHEAHLEFMKAVEAINIGIKQKIENELV